MQLCSSYSTAAKKASLFKSGDVDGKSTVPHSDHGCQGGGARNKLWKRKWKSGHESRPQIALLDASVPRFRRVSGGHHGWAQEKAVATGKFTMGPSPIAHIL